MWDLKMTQFNWLLKQFSEEVKPLQKDHKKNKTGGNNLLPGRSNKTMRNNG